MYSRCFALIGACISIIAVGPSFAETAPAKNTLVVHDAWLGYFDQTETRDGSLLNEFVAQTMSVNVLGAALSLSMIPRFSCLPVVSLVIDDESIASKASDIEITVELDDQSFDYPNIPDVDRTNVRFTLSTVALNQEKLRSIVDVASWATFRWSVKSNVPQLSNTSSTDESVAELYGIIDFSLLGSQKTIEAVEEMCRSHIPIPLNN